MEKVQSINDKIISELDKLQNASLYGQEADSVYALVRDTNEVSTLACLTIPNALGVLRHIVKVMSNTVTSQDALIKIIAAIPKVSIIEDFI